MRILILGGNGMLGHELLLSLQKKHNVRVTLREGLDHYDATGLFTRKNTFANVDVHSIDSVQAVISDFSPEAVINAIGIIKQREDASAYIPSIEINALFPHKLSEICKKASARLIHVSTDCVFSGKKGNYLESDFADADDLYGRTKYLGEISEGNCITLRTSIIGLELHHKKSLIEWFLSQRGEINGFRKAIYSGLTTMEIARIIENILLTHQDIFGIYHVASSPISKYDLLNKLASLLKRDIVIQPVDTFVCDRSLNADHFTQATGYVAPGWDIMLAELANRINSREETGTV